MPEKLKNVGVSVRARLRNLPRDSQSFELLLTRYALERLLYRLAQSRFRDRFVLKGAMLVSTWFDTPFRPTRDVDFLGYGDPDADAMLAIFREICSLDADDGVVLDVNGLKVDRIREELEYGGLRLTTTATIGGARVRAAIDIGFGDATKPGIEEIEYPVLLDGPPLILRAYPKETVIAEKFQAMVALGLANTRMKDFYDVWLISRGQKFAGDRLPRAIAATFKRRGTEIPSALPEALSVEFSSDPSKRQQWHSFLSSIAVPEIELPAVIDELAAFLMPQVAAARTLADA